MTVLKERRGAGNQRMRIRGVRASRVKLNRAMAEAGIKTQAALAERIADLEGIDSAPKDLVSRVFRGKWVDPLSLERVARALNITAHGLYLSSDEADELPTRILHPPANPGDPRQPPGNSEIVASFSPVRARWRWTVAGCIGLSLLLTTGLAFNWPSSRQFCSIKSFLLGPHSAPDRLNVLISRFQNDPDNLAQSYLAAVFRNNKRLAAYVSVVTTCRCLAFGNGNESGAALRALRARGRLLLQDSSAQILLWGRRDGDLLEVRFISSRPDDDVPMPVTLGNDILPIRETSLQIPLRLGQPSMSLANIETLSLNLIRSERPSIQKLRQQAIANYKQYSDTRNTLVITNLEQSAHRPPF